MLMIAQGPPKLDLETYISNYEGRTRFARLAMIGSSSTYLRFEATKAAVREAKKGIDISRYKDAVERLHMIAPDDEDATVDDEWVDKTTREVKATTDRMEVEIKGYKNNLIKESIRIGNEELGRHSHAMGDVQKASQAFNQMRDHCTSAKQIAEMMLKIVQVAIEQNQWVVVQTQISKIRSLQLKREDEAKIGPKLHAALGITYLCSGNYAEAAGCFIATDASLGSSFNNVLSANDVATYGGLCALASMNPNELQERCLDRTSFRAHLELEPDLRRAIIFFCESKFPACLDILNGHRADFFLDLYLRPRAAGQLLDLIRAKCIIQALVPFRTMSLPGLARAFRTDRDEMEDELVDLIKMGSLRARIDTFNDLVVSEPAQPRSTGQQDLFITTDRFESSARLSFMILAISSAGLEVKGHRIPPPPLLPALGSTTSSISTGSAVVAGVGAAGGASSSSAGGFANRLGTAGGGGGGGGGAIGATGATIRGSGNEAIPSDTTTTTTATTTTTTTTTTAAAAAAATAATTIAATTTVATDGSTNPSNHSTSSNITFVSDEGIW